LIYRIRDGSENPALFGWIVANSPTALQRQWKWGNAQIKKGL